MMLTHDFFLYESAIIDIVRRNNFNSRCARVRAREQRAHTHTHTLNQWHAFTQAIYYNFSLFTQNIPHITYASGKLNK